MQLENKRTTTRRFRTKLIVGAATAIVALGGTGVAVASTVHTGTQKTVPQKVAASPGAESQASKGSSSSSLVPGQHAEGASDPSGKGAAAVPDNSAPKKSKTTSSWSR